MLTHRRSVNEFELPVEGAALVIAVKSPPWLKAGTNRLELRQTHWPDLALGSNAVWVSDVLLWFQRRVDCVAGCGRHEPGRACGINAPAWSALANPL